LLDIPKASTQGRRELAVSHPDEVKKGRKVRIQFYLKRPSPFLQRLLGRKIEPDTVDESELPEGILTVLADKPQQALAAAFRCRPLNYRQIALLMEVSRDRVRQLEMRAADTLRRANRFRQLCRFIPGWQNALRLPPADKTSPLPGEAIPLEFMRKHNLQHRQNLAGLKSKKNRHKATMHKKKKFNNRAPFFKRKA
jgi:hypothetical protein